jgi:hypothetical protein
MVMMMMMMTTIENFFSERDVSEDRSLWGKVVDLLDVLRFMYTL